MSIPKTKEQIAEIQNPDTRLLLNYSTGLKDGQHQWRTSVTPLTGPTLQALADSHTRLLTAAKAYLQPQPNDAQSERVLNELVKAVEEGERL